MSAAGQKSDRRTDIAGVSVRLLFTGSACLRYEAAARFILLFSLCGQICCGRVLHFLHKYDIMNRMHFQKL